MSARLREQYTCYSPNLTLINGHLCTHLQLFLLCLLGVTGLNIIFRSIEVLSFHLDALAMSKTPTSEEEGGKRGGENDVTGAGATLGPADGRKEGRAIHK